MKFGTGFPLLAADNPAVVRDFAQALDGAGFDFVTVGGHLLTAEADRFPDRPNATYVGPFYEPFVLFSYLAAITERLAFRPSVLILPLFPAALVAKQAMELSVLSGGRFQLGVGISWNPAEYQAMDQDFANRGARLEEQIAVLRLLWSEPLVTFQGRWHTLDRVGLNQLPPSPIPIWFGSGADEKVLRRVARLGDGWMPMGDPTEALPRLRQYLIEAERDPATFGLTLRVTAGPDGPASWIETARRLEAQGATDIVIGTPSNLSQPEALARLIEAKNVLAAEFGS